MPARICTRRNGSIIGGLLADTYWQSLEVHKLWVSEAHRNAGHVSRLMNAAENEAHQRDCKHAFLDAFNFQALGFYQKLGYSELGQLAHEPACRSRRMQRLDKWAEGLLSYGSNGRNGV